MLRNVCKQYASSFSSCLVSFRNITCITGVSANPTSTRSTYFDLSLRRPPKAVAVPMSVLTNGKVNSRFDSIDLRTLYVNLINSFQNCNLTLFGASKTRNINKVELEHVLKPSSIPRGYKKFPSKLFLS